MIGSFEGEEQYQFIHKCSTKGGSSGSPILNLKNKLIGIHKEGKNKYNIGTFLNYPIKDFIEECKKNQIIFNNEIINNNNINNINNNEILIKEFNNKYKTEIGNINVVKLMLGRKKLGDEGLKELTQIPFKEIKELNLYINSISDIESLKNFICEKLEILLLNNNKIADISVLEKVKFEALKELNLSKNIIANIKVLAKVKFDKLEILDLGNNQISDINVLEQVNFKDLQQLI